METVVGDALDFGGRDFRSKPISPLREIGAYEALWDEDGASFRTIAQKFRSHPGAVPSDFVPDEKIDQYAKRVVQIVSRAGLEAFGVRVHGGGEYPARLRDAADPVELLYFQGWWDLAGDRRSVAVVGTRKPSANGIARTRKLVKRLVADDFTIVSGLAKGIDSVAHSTAIDAKGRTIAVIGTPLSVSYPKENRRLQKVIAEEFLLISQVPFCRYQRQPPKINKFFFPERNITMSALTEATIIVEAGETSGTLVQARAALRQNRKLFILDNCFKNPNLTWPEKFAARGAIRVSDYDDIRQHLLDSQAHQN